MQRLFKQLTATLFQSFKYPVITPTLISITLLAVAYSPAAQDALVLLNGDLWSQIWRIFGTHLVHLSLLHAVANIAGLWLFSFAFKSFFSNRLLFNVILISALFATLVPVYLANDYQFVGFSGVLHGVFAYAALRTFTLNKTKGRLLLAALIIKLGYDLMTAGQAVAWLNGAHVAYLCHIGGALGGIIAVPSLRKTSQQLLQRR